MKTILVTGTTGFIASHLLPLLTDYRIIAAIRNPCRSLSTAPHRTVVVGDINGQTDWQSALQSVEAVIHLAARAHILQDQTSDREAAFHRINVEGTANLARQSLEAGVKQFILMSSIGAVATLSDRILSESSPCRPDTPYGRSKLAAEQGLIELCQNQSMTWTIIRPTLVYGAGNPGNMERLMNLVDRGRPLPLGAIKNRRSFVYVGNLVDAILTCLEHPQAANQRFLISDGQDVSTPALVHLIAQQRGQNSQLLPIPPGLLRLAGKLGDTWQNLRQRPVSLNSETIDRLLGSLYVDSSYIRDRLNWHPPYTMEQGLAQTLK
ncbi:MAG: NAD-dependent epimerase/dehydratase family protein [Chloroflexaceae bacterium]|nr:NAD-dependent epimerase/dehydratase family protein [Chloroflexaceae bacterium]